jgi:hypothetical protein
VLEPFIADKQRQAVVAAPGDWRLIRVTADDFAISTPQSEHPFCCWSDIRRKAQLIRLFLGTPHSFTLHLLFTQM